MPIYEYTCADCGAGFEALVFTAESAASLTCPKCSSGSIVKKMSVFAPSVAHSGPALPPRCETSGPCGSPNMPGCRSGMCGLG
ncbi:MAG: zinc ribbon domain-containing protein [Nitrospinae bacterium]|nr:zinc ribbon domain-containing protein [Nitrospinota bacterium]